jgi:hypothetical protein
MAAVSETLSQKKRREQGKRQFPSNIADYTKEDVKELGHLAAKSLLPPDKRDQYVKEGVPHKRDLVDVAYDTVSNTGKDVVDTVKNIVGSDTREAAKDLGKYVGGHIAEGAKQTATDIKNKFTGSESKQTESTTTKNPTDATREGLYGKKVPDAPKPTTPAPKPEDVAVKSGETGTPKPEEAKNITDVVCGGLYGAKKGVESVLAQQDPNAPISALAIPGDDKVDKKPDGTVIIKKKDGTIIERKDGITTLIKPDGTKTIVRNKFGGDGWGGEDVLGLKYIARNIARNNEATLRGMRDNRNLAVGTIGASSKPKPGMEGSLNPHKSAAGSINVKRGGTLISRSNGGFGRSHSSFGFSSSSGAVNQRRIGTLNRPNVASFGSSNRGNPVGDMRRSGNPLGDITRGGNPVGQVTRVGNPLGEITKTGNPIGNVTKTGNPLGQITRQGNPVANSVRASQAMREMNATVNTGSPTTRKEGNPVAKAIRASQAMREISATATQKGGIAATRKDGNPVANTIRMSQKMRELSPVNNVSEIANTRKQGNPVTNTVRMSQKLREVGTKKQGNPTGKMPKQGNPVAGVGHPSKMMRSKLDKFVTPSTKRRSLVGGA